MLLERIQYLQGMDVIFSLLSLTNNSVFAVFPQIASRCIVVKAIFPYVPKGHWAITLTVAMWCSIELIRYPFYTIKSVKMLQNGFLSSLFGHLRYNAFIIVYPLGVTGELASNY